MLSFIRCIHIQHLSCERSKLLPLPFFLDPLEKNLFELAVVIQGQADAGFRANIWMLTRRTAEVLPFFVALAIDHAPSGPSACVFATSVIFAVMFR